MYFFTFYHLTCLVALVHAQASMAPTATATEMSAAVTSSPQVQSDPSPSRFDRRLFGICIPYFEFLGDCQTQAGTASPTPNQSSTTSNTPSPTGSGSPISSGAGSPTASPTAPPTTSVSASTVDTSKSFSYSQPAVPFISARPSSPKVNGPYNFPFGWPQPQTRYYTLDMVYAAGAPGGYRRRLKTFNYQFPGPILEANQGDTMVIRVNNHLDEPQSVHWHGMRQNGTNAMDGVPGVSQCSIPPGGSFTYQFSLQDELGTYWYHSHYANSQADGLVGALIIHSKNSPLQRGGASQTSYTDDQVIHLADFQNDDSDIIIEGLMDGFTNGYRGSPIPPDPDSALLNGKGQVNCSAAQAGVQCNPRSSFSEMSSKVGGRLRLRLINSGSHSTIRFSVDKHKLLVVEVDDTPVVPFTINEVQVATAQRVSVVIQLNQGNPGDSFYMRARVAMNCLNPTAPQIETKGILRYLNVLGFALLPRNPQDQPWSDLKGPQDECLDIDIEHDVQNFETTPAWPVYRTDSIISAFGQWINREGRPYIGFGYNNITFVNYINDPLLRQVEAGLSLDDNPHAHLAHLTYDRLGAVDIVINQLDPEPLAHPFHLHGRPFQIVARGRLEVAVGPNGQQQGIPLTIEQATALPKSEANPLMRDTVLISHNSYAIIRVITDTPGVWPIHCHIGWHLAVGKLGAIIVRPDVIRTFTQPPAWNGLCADTDPGAIGPAKRNVFDGITPATSRARDITHQPMIPGYVSPQQAAKRLEGLSDWEKRDVIANGQWE